MFLPIKAGSSCFRSKREAPLVSFASLRCSFLCVAVADKKQETQEVAFQCCFNNVRCFWFASLCSHSLSAAFLSSFAFPRLIGGLWLRFLATQTAKFEELLCRAVVYVALIWDNQLERVSTPLKWRNVVVHCIFICYICQIHAFFVL